MSNYHKGVLLYESVDGLAIRQDGIYVDVTFGAGGYSREILKRLGSKGRLYAFDQDEDALNNRIYDARFQLINDNFSNIKRCLMMQGVTKVDGIVADLGVSSHQFDEASRGFSYRFEAELDMRMDKSSDLTAKTIINEYEESDLLRILRSYGELTNARKVVYRLVQKRMEGEISTTGQLVKVLSGLGGKKEMKFLAQVFQALRIEVNKEVEVLRVLLNDGFDLLASNGRFVVVSYHSLEDRLAKNFFRTGKLEGEMEKDFFGNSLSPFRLITRKPMIPSEEEIEDNSRARSAKLRIAEKV